MRSNNDMHIGNRISSMLVTPTPGQTGSTTLEVGPPSGWVAAGLLVLLLSIMIYQSLVKAIKKLFRPKKRN